VTAGLLLIALTASACGGGIAHHASGATGASFVPSGTLLVDTRGYTQLLMSYRLPNGPSKTLSDYFGEYRLGAAWGPRNVAYTMEQSSFGLRPDAQLFLATAGTRPEPVGEPVKGGSGFAFGGNLAVTWSCAAGLGSVFVMDVTSDHSSWTRIARGCEAGISPDGQRIAFTNGRSVWEGAPEPGAPTQVLSVGQLREHGIHRFQLDAVGIAVGADGFAVPARSRRLGSAIVVAVGGRAPQVIPLGGASIEWMAWQPKGQLLAFVDYVDATQSNEIRTFDPVTGTVRELAVTSSQGLVWAPDGRSLAIFKGASVVAYVDAAGQQLGTGSIPGGPDDWKS
jgi:hypothetical protein